MWIRLYNLQHEYWNEETFAQIGNKLGTFIKVDEAITSNDYNMYARICIYWQDTHPLPRMVELKTGEGVWKQMLEVREDKFDSHFLWSKVGNEDQDQQSEEALGNNLDGPWNQSVNETLVIENLLVSNATQGENRGRTPFGDRCISPHIDRVELEEEVSKGLEENLDLKIQSKDVEMSLVGNSF
ncbi:hypothetical protein SUGI_0962890 [Cryptomeria japonica]|nr:hypothetical protein SUGI_0962890 [Cryptomeria japonica]